MRPVKDIWLWPRSLVGRTVLILIVGLTASHLLSFLIYESEKRNALGLAAHGQLADRIVTIAKLVRDATPTERDRIIEASNGSAFNVELATASAVSTVVGREPRLLREALSLRLADMPAESFRLSVTSPDVGLWPALKHLVAFGDAAHPMKDHLRRVAEHLNGGETIRAAILITDGTWLNFSVPSPEYYVTWTPRFVLSIIIMLGSVVVFSLWAVRQTVEPLKEFTDAAERLGRNLDDAPLLLTGSLEVRRAAHVFNTMHARIQKFVEDRTRMIAAISHDLRTPLTRMRFRGELIEDEEQREKIVRDIEEMEAMITATLAFARDEAQSEPVRQLNLSDIVNEIAAGMNELGHVVSIDAPDALTVACRPVSLRRALTNVVENAVRYDGPIGITVGTENGFVKVSVIDEGPGIPEEQMEDVFRPFRRLERSRNKETGGVGLGLSVARNIIRAQGGDIVLRNRDTGGLRAEVRLPA